MKAFIGSQISRYHCDSLSAWRNCRGKGGESGFVPTATFNTHKQCWELMFAWWVHDRSFHNCRMWRIVKLQSDHSKHSWEASPISMTEIPVPESQPYCGYFLLWRDPPLDGQKHFLSRVLPNSPARFPLPGCMNLLDGKNRLQGEKLWASASHICGSKHKYKNARISLSTLKALFYCATTSTVVFESPFLGMEGFSSRGDTTG